MDIDEKDDNETENVSYQNDNVNGKNGKFKLKNKTEILFYNTAQSLIAKGLMNECHCNELFDSFMIDFVLVKYIKLTKKIVRLVLHIQLKKKMNGAEKHKNRCPSIPVMVLHPDLSINKAEKKILRFFLRIFEESAYYKRIRQEFRRYI